MDASVIYTQLSIQIILFVFYLAWGQRHKNAIDTACAAAIVNDWWVDAIKANQVYICTAIELMLSTCHVSSVAHFSGHP